MPSPAIITIRIVTGEDVLLVHPCSRGLFVLFALDLGPNRGPKARAGPWARPVTRSRAGPGRVGSKRALEKSRNKISSPRGSLMTDFEKKRQSSVQYSFHSERRNFKTKCHDISR